MSASPTTRRRGHNVIILTQSQVSCLSDRTLSGCLPAAETLMSLHLSVLILSITYMANCSPHCHDPSFTTGAHPDALPSSPVIVRDICSLSMPYERLRRDIDSSRPRGIMTGVEGTADGCVWVNPDTCTLHVAKTVMVLFNFSLVHPLGNFSNYDCSHFSRTGRYFRNVSEFVPKWCSLSLDSGPLPELTVLQIPLANTLITRPSFISTNLQMGERQLHHHAHTI